MKKYLFLALISLLASCSSYNGLVGTYPANNHFAETDLSTEQVWARIIDYFAINAIPIKLIDKASGLIVSEEISFLEHYTREENGKPIDPDAYVVIPTRKAKFFDNMPIGCKYVEPECSEILYLWNMPGSWNIRVKSNGDKTLVNINIISLSCSYTTKSVFSIVSSAGTHMPISSTGVFEAQFLEYLTK